MLKPATKNNEISEELRILIEATVKWLDPSSFTFRKIERSIQNLMKVDALDGSLRMAELVSMTGDMEAAHRWIHNARLVGAPKYLCAGVQMGTYGNLGYFTRSAELYGAAVALENNNLIDNFCSGLVCGAFNAMIVNIDAQRRSQLAWGAENDAAADVATAAVEVLDRMGLNETDVQAMLDVAGEVLRAEREMWLRFAPVVRVTNTSDDTGLLYQYYVDGSAARASALTDRVIDLMIDRDLDRPGLAFSFLPDNIQEA